MSGRSPATGRAAWAISSAHPPTRPTTTTEQPAPPGAWIAASPSIALARLGRPCYKVAPRPIERERSKETPLRNPPRRQASVERKTKETRIKGTVDLDGTGAYDVV